jgi:hypothetical protein
VFAPEGFISRLIARVRARLAKDWFGEAGERFRKTTETVSNFAKEHRVRPKDLLEEGVDLTRRKITGLANKEFA